MEQFDSSLARNNQQILEAADQLFVLDSCESAVANLEQIILAKQDTWEQLHGLLRLNRNYFREFGVHFEQRHVYRQQLFRVLAGQIDTVDAARAKTHADYADNEGRGLPRLVSLVTAA